MNIVKANLLKVKDWYQKGWAQWLLATVFFVLTSWLYMGASLPSCSTTTPAFNSDTSGGMVWFQWASGNGLRWHDTTKSNYPFGESLNRPQEITSEGLDLPYRSLAAVSSPICGLNLLILLGYVSTGLLMFGLIRWLYKKPAIALFAGYAAAYVPYHRLKSQSHVAYMTAAVFIAMVWAYLWFASRPSYKRIGLVAALTALGMYTDGYFVLMSAVLASLLIGGGFIRDLWKLRSGTKAAKQTVLTHLRYIVAFGLIVAALVSPILYVQKYHGALIKQTLTSARGNIKSDARSYGARPVEFLLPAYNNPLLPQSYANWRLSDQHNSNPSEDTMYVGWTIIVLAVIGVIGLNNPTFRRKLVRPNVSYAYLVGLILFAGAVSFSLSLPYRFTFLGILWHTPVDLVIKLTSNWRVFARFFLVVDPLLIILAAGGLYIVTRRLKSVFYGVVIVVCFVLLFLEYLMTPLAPHGNLVTQTPRLYHTIAQDSSVKVLAEYPLLSFNDVPSIFTFQQLHGKPEVNANDTAIQMSAYDQSIAGLGDVQTLGVLKQRGVSVVTSYGQDTSSLPGLAVYQPPDVSAHKIGLPTIYSYRLSASVVPREAVLAAGQGFNITTVDDTQIGHHVLSVPGQLTVLATTPGSLKHSSYQVSFLVSRYDNQIAPPLVSVVQNGKIIWRSQIDQTTTANVTALPNQAMTVTTTTPIDITQLSALPAGS